MAISQGVPRGWRGLRYLALAPPWALLKAARQPGGAAVYDHHYGDLLARLDPRTVLKDLRALAVDPVLLC